MNFYNLLELPFDATQDEIRKAYFDAAKIYHPDLSTTPEVGEKFLKIQEAYATLIDADRRKAYDAKIPDESKNLKQIQVNAFYSRSNIPVIDDEQLFYLLLDIFATNQKNPDLLPPVNICLILDKSTSMQGTLLEKIKTETVNLLKLLRDYDTVSVVAFSDFAEVIIPPTQVAKIQEFVTRIQAMKASGATEIFQGLNAGVEVLRSIPSAAQVKQIILLTDGHTYGDEEKCIQLMRDAAEEGISFHAIGIGEEWNDQFLDELSKISSGETSFVSSAQEMYDALVDKIKSSGISFAKSVKINLELGPNVELTYSFRMSPDLSALEIGNQIGLGNLLMGKHLRVLLEFRISKMEGELTELKIMQGTLKFFIPSNEINVTRMFFDLRKPVTRTFEKDPPPPLIVNAMSNLTLYRIQEKARKEAKEGNIASATRHLHHVATHLLAQGDRKLARTVLEEAENLKVQKSFSELGEKRMKYGTRSLMLLPDPERNEDDYLP
jgi:Ca-activated chloride channel family protein